MLLGSNFILNSAQGIDHTAIHPFAHQYINNRSVANQLCKVNIPDVDTFDLPPTAQFSMAAGDFLEVYTEEAQWDCIASCFFLDTARNIVVYLEQMFHILKPGGYLINLGPLLFHFDGNREAPSIELCWDELRAIIIGIGFDIVKEEYPRDAPCVFDLLLLLSFSTRLVFCGSFDCLGPTYRCSRT
jgi:carnosine N-methyltransferase